MASLNKVSLLLVAAVLGTAIAALTPAQSDLLMHENLKKPIIKNATEACKHMLPEPDPCMLNCLYKKLGMLDESGRYVESKAAETLAIYFEGILTRAQVATIAKACNSSNASEIKSTCARGVALAGCIQNETFKLMIGERP